MDIEAVAVGAVKLAIGKTNYLSEYINDKDKEPMWDGSIYAYSSKSKNNECFIGKASVQIKGKSINGDFKKEIGYDIKVIDLENYRKNGGIIFFVVAINNKGNTKIYYKSLTPFFICKILKEKLTQKTLNVKFSKFPDDSNEICNMVIDFINDSKRQELFTHNKTPSEKDFFELVGEDATYEFQYTGIGLNRDDPYKYLFNRNFYIYARIKKLDISFPIEHITNIDKLTYNPNEAIKIDNKLYYNKIEIVRKIDSYEIVIGKSLVIFSNNTDAKIKFNLKGNIKERIDDIQFLIDFIERKNFTIGDCKFSLKSLDNGSIFSINDALNHLKDLKKLDNLLNNLGIRKKLEMDNLSKKDYEHIEMLVKAFIDKKPISFKKGDIPRICCMNIGNINLLLYLNKQNDNNYIIENFPNAEINAKSKSQNDILLDVSKYFNLTSELIVKVDNIRCNQIVDDFIKYENEINFYYANIVLLEIIKSYDKTKDIDILDEATRLAGWLNKLHNYDMYHKINYYQCLYRKGNLSIEQQEDILEHISEYSDNLSIKAGIYILADQKNMAQNCLKNMNEEERLTFKNFPIYTLL